MFFTTARQAHIFADLLNAAGQKALAMHSRMSQPQREKSSAQFRQAASAILCSSDVSARGLDYPDVTLVLQVCAGVSEGGGSRSSH